MTVLLNNYPTKDDVLRLFGILNRNIKTLRGNWETLLEFSRNKPDNLKVELVEEYVKCSLELEFIDGKTKNSDKTVESYSQLCDDFLRVLGSFSHIIIMQDFEDLKLEELEEFEKT